ncbi:MAG TPA: rhodanese-like domain-containing protein [Xanthomonadales bacterium]|nr:rhodanese-like domain-containing protein [Xanthomonadales bacterium]
MFYPKKVIIAGIILIFFAGAMVSQNRTNKLPSGHSEQTHYKASSHTPKELSEMIKKDRDKYALIDVRTKLEYEKGHLPGAVHADYYDTEALKKAAGDKIPVAYCAYSAMRGPYAAYQLYQAGFKNVAVLDGGISAWAEDIQGADSSNPSFKTIFNHPKNIFPDRGKSEYPPNKKPVEINITATQFLFTPNKIIVEHGQKVTLHMMSLDVAHGFALPEFGIEEELLPREAVTITFIADRRGNFPFVCNVICGHDHPSMVGNFIVK